MAPDISTDTIELDNCFLFSVIGYESQWKSVGIMDNLAEQAWTYDLTNTYTQHQTTDVQICVFTTRQPKNLTSM